MEYKAEAKNVRMSPRKVRLVADSVRELGLEQALSSLMVLNKRAASPIKKAIESAIANAVNNFQASRGDLTIKEIMIGEGDKYKRYHYAARGRTRPYVKRSSHIRIILQDAIVQESTPVVSDEKVKDEKPMKETKAKKGATK